MSELIGTFTYNTLEMLGKQGHSFGGVLKQAFVIFDRICYQTRGFSEGSNPIEVVAAHAATNAEFTNDDEYLSLVRNKRFRSTIIGPHEFFDGDWRSAESKMGAFMLERSDPMLRFKLRDRFSYADYTRRYSPRTSKRYENYCRRKNIAPWDGIYTIERYVHDQRRRLFAEMAAGEYVHSRSDCWSALDNALVGALGDLAVLGIVREKHPNAMSFGSELHARVVPIIEPHSTLADLSEVIATLQASRDLPSFANFSWDQILELRRDPYIASFRAKLVDSVAKKSNGTADEIRALDVELLETLWKIVADLKPTPSRIVRTGLEPLLWFFGAIFALVSQWRHARKYGWVFFLENARRLGKMHDADDKRGV
jgi:hypothetical protein